ncbi:MAG: HD domain-containing protein [Phenylobacterium sp.]
MSNDIFKTSKLFLPHINKLHALSSYRNLSYEIEMYPEIFIKDLEKDPISVGSYFIPVDVIELRFCLEDYILDPVKTRIAFSWDFAKKHLLDYPILLKIKNDFCGCEVGSIKFIEDNPQKILKSVKEIVIQHGFACLEDKIKSIIDDDIHVSFNYDVEGLASKKIASNNRVKHKYIINIDTLDIINEETMATTEGDAVEQVLGKKWKQISKEIGATFRPAKYRVGYWAKTPFWNTIVRKKANSNKVSKLAQSSPLSPLIKLNQIEQNIFNLLLSVKNYFPQLNDLEMRVAGGWTRDKLLGIECDDIDIALSSISGKDFVKYIVEFSNAKMQNNTIGKTYIVDQNIEKSKHLETAGIDLFGQKVEFVNLRSETYGDSRIPIATMGSPEQDARRRDLTINALFYNIETKKVEDYVGGIEDLKTMTLRTPKLNPDKTDIENAIEIFSQDPLRMLRVLRFYSRYPNSTIDSSVIEAIKNPLVQEGYTKLAPERASTEIIKIMQGSRPAEATKILLNSGLYKKVFNLPEDVLDINMDQQNLYHDMSLMDHTLAVIKNLNSIAIKQGVSKEERGLLNISALLHDFGKMFPDIRKPHPKEEGKFQYIDHEKRSADFAKETLERMAFPEDAKKFVQTVVKNHMAVHRLLPKNGKLNYAKVGKFLNEVGELYDKILYHGLADEMSKSKDAPPPEVEQSRNEQKQLFDQYYFELGESLNKPLLNGNEIRKIVLTYSPEMVDKNAFLTSSKFGPKPLHYLSFITKQILEKQWSRHIRTKDDAEQFVVENIKSWYNNWKDQQNKDSLNKQADASSSEDPAGFDGYEGDYQLNEDRGIVRAPYFTLMPFVVGDKVRLRSRGLAFQNSIGRVKKIKDGILIVQWEQGKHKGKKSKFSLDDTVRLFGSLEKM